MNEYRILVCGGRDYDDAERLVKELDIIVAEYVPKDARLVLIHGGAHGADAIAESWAEWHNLDIMAFPADWDRYGRAAGVIRNAQMLEEGQPDLVVAAPGGTCTANMVRQAQAAGIPTIILKE